VLSIQQKRLLLHHRLHHSLAAAASTALTLSHSLTHSPACSLVWLYRCSHTLRFSFVGSCCHSIYVLSHSHVDMYQRQPRVTLVAVVLLALACLLAGEAQVSIPSHTPPNTLHGAVLGHRHELVLTRTSTQAQTVLASSVRSTIVPLINATTEIDIDFINEIPRAMMWIMYGPGALSCTTTHECVLTVACVMVRVS